MEKSGSVLGGGLLIAGSCIGAGMLALPIVTGIAGFTPSLVMFLLAWLFMALSGSLLLRVNLSVGYELSLISLSQRTLGPVGKWVCTALFLFLFYSLNVAYISALGPICQSLMMGLFGVTIDPGVARIALTALFAAVIYAGVRPVDLCNRLLMVGLALAYVALVGFGAKFVAIDHLLYSHWSYAFGALPVLIISFGYHNMIPSLARYFKGDGKRLKQALWIGTLLPLIVYLIWQLVMLGMIPQEEIIQAKLRGDPATLALQATVGNGSVNTVGQLFAFFAIVTSLLAQSLSLVDFLADGMKVSREGRSRLMLIVIALLPPLLFAFWKPGLFLHALSIAGGLAAVILFGVLPALMVLKERLSTSRLILGGVLVVALSLFTIQLLEEFGLSVLPGVI